MANKRFQINETELVAPSLLLQGDTSGELNSGDSVYRVDQTNLMATKKANPSVLNINGMSIVEKLTIVEETADKILISLNQNGQEWNTENDQHNSNKFQTYGAVMALLQAAQGCLHGTSSLILTTPLGKYTNEDANGLAGLVGSSYDGTPFVFEHNGVTYSVRVPIEDVPDTGWKALYFGDEPGVLSVGGTVITSKNPATRRRAYKAKAMRAILNGKNVSVTCRGEYLQTGLDIKALMQATTQEEVNEAAKVVSGGLLGQLNLSKQQVAETTAAGFETLQTGANSQEVLQSFDFVVPLAEGGEINLATVSGSRVDCVNEIGRPLVLWMRGGNLASRQGTVNTIRNNGLKVVKVS